MNLRHRPPTSKAEVFLPRQALFLCTVVTLVKGGDVGAKRSVPLQARNEGAIISCAAAGESRLKENSNCQNLYSSLVRTPGLTSSLILLVLLKLPCGVQSIISSISVRT